MTRADQDLWVFAYGSLMWRPDFEFVERIGATLFGYHRALCIISVHHRGTAEAPGLVLGLDRGGSCRGVAYRIGPAQRDHTLAYLREREQVTSVYLETSHDLLLADGRTVRGLAYTADRSHAQFAKGLTLEERFKRVRHAVGVSGSNPDYVRATCHELETLGIHDRGLLDLVHLLESDGAYR
jgi:glutathione-specific gamma-glutamylcyclotransferase